MKKIITTLLLLTTAAISHAQINPWELSTERKMNIRESEVKKSNFKIFSLDTERIAQELKSVPKRTVYGKENGVTIRFPNLDGAFRTYKIMEASTMTPQLQEKYGDIRSFVGYDIDNPLNKIRFTIDPYFGLNGMFRENGKIVYIDSYTYDNKNYILYDRKDAKSSRAHQCLVDETDDEKKLHVQKLENKTVVDGLLRTYRLAIATTIEYTTYISQQAGVANGTDAQKKAATMAAINLSVNRLNEIYENDLSVTFQLVPNNDSVIFIANDTYDPTSASQMTNENQVIMDNVIGNANYDIGHVFFRATQGNDNGLAATPAVCNIANKARAVTGSAIPVGDPFVIDFVAHEVGHQFGARHTQNNGCNRYTPTSIEPGSASTIMGYAGICSPNVQSNSDAYFHSVSIAEMYLRVTGGGNCAVNTVTENNEPIVNAGLDRTIPKDTPFLLQGTATDPDGDAITYNWEQIDFGAAPMPPQPTNAVGPLFRSIFASSSAGRYFPRLSTIVEGYDPTIFVSGNYRTWEKLPSVDRVMNFSLLVRDNNPLGGQTGRDDIQLTVVSSAGPFVVTSQNTAGTVWNVGESKTISWNVANTNILPVNTPNVTILMSLDGGQTFPVTLVSSTPNNGSYTFTVPAGIGVSSNARIMVKAIDNVFLNVNTQNFSINSTLGTSDLIVDENEFSIYPNPSNGVFTIQTKSKQDIQYSVYSADGRLLIGDKILMSRNGMISDKIDLSDFISGVYLLKLSLNGTTVTKKLMIKK